MKILSFNPISCHKVCVASYQFPIPPITLPQPRFLMWDFGQPAAQNPTLSLFPTPLLKKCVALRKCNALLLVYFWITGKNSNSASIRRQNENSELLPCGSKAIALRNSPTVAATGRLIVKFTVPAALVLTEVAPRIASLAIPRAIADRRGVELDPEAVLGCCSACP